MQPDISNIETIIFAIENGTCKINQNYMYM